MPDIDPDMALQLFKQGKLSAQTLLKVKQAHAAAEAPVREIPEPVESPAEREKRFLSRPPEGETPEQRTNRYLERARREGYTHESPMQPQGLPPAAPTPAAPLPATGGDILSAYHGTKKAINDSPLTKKVDDTLQKVQANPTVRAASDATDRGIESIRSTLGRVVERSADGLVDTFASPERKSQILQRKIQAAQEQIAANKEALAGREGQPAIELDGPAERHPTMQREFSNEEEKKRYLEEIAKKGK